MARKPVRPLGRIELLLFTELLADFVEPCTQ
jgi:hypothetical protein